MNVAMLPDPAPARPERAPRGFVVAIVVVELVALGALTAPLTVGLALRVRRLDLTWSPEQALALVVGLGAVAAMLANPVFGALADRTRHRGAGRAGWMLGGVVAGALALGLLLSATSLAGLAAAWCLAQAAYNATFAALYGYLADVPEPDRARVSGLFGAAATGAVVVAMAVATVLPKEPAWVIGPMPVLAVVVTAVVYGHLRRTVPAAPAPARSRARPRPVLRGQGQYWLVWVQRFLAQLAYGVVTGYGLFFLLRRTDATEEAAATWVAATAAVAALLGAVTSVLAGRAAGRRGRYGGYLAAALALLGVALVVKALGTTVAAYVVASLLVGVGMGCYLAVDLALVLRTVPPERAGQLLGLFNVARTLPQSIAPAIAPVLLAVGEGDVVGGGEQNYFAYYAFGLGVLVLAVLPLRWLRVLRRSPA